MTVRVLLHVALFLLPFVAYFAYARWANARRAQTGVDPLQTPWFWLIVAGFVLAILGFLVPSFLVEPQTGRYIPAQVIDGKLVPGHFEPGDGQPAHVEPPRAPPPGSSRP